MATSRALRSTVVALPVSTSTSCPFLFHSNALPTQALPALVQKFRGQCPFLSSLHFSKHVSAKLDAQQQQQQMRSSSSLQQLSSAVDDAPPVIPPSAAVAGDKLCWVSAGMKASPSSTSLSAALPAASMVTEVREVKKEAAATAVSADAAAASVLSSAATSLSAPASASAMADAVLSRKVESLKDEGRYRVFIDIERQRGAFPQAFNHHTPPAAVNHHTAARTEAAAVTASASPTVSPSVSPSPPVVTVWCNNDYLCMGQHPVVLSAMQQTISECGAGAGGTRNISGTTPHHTRLERTLAAAHEKEAALVFTSGYVANDATLSTVGRLLPRCHFFSDALNHASMIEGMKHSGARRSIFRHNDVQHLRQLLADSAQAEPDAHRVVVFESVYSMDGDIAPIGDVCDAADEYGALTFLDEVHAVGLYGAKGGGVAQRDGLSDRISLVSGTMAKGYGVFGGYIAGSAPVVDAIRSFASGFIFTSSLPPAVAAACEASVRYLMHSQTERSQHQERARRLKELLLAANLPVLLSPSHIVPLMIGDAKLCKAASDLLLSRHRLYCQPINYPTVPRGTERLRLTPGPHHSDDMMERLVQALDDVWRELSLPRQFSYELVNGVLHVERDAEGAAITCCNVMEKRGGGGGGGGAGRAAGVREGGRLRAIDGGLQQWA